MEPLTAAQLKKRTINAEETTIAVLLCEIYESVKKAADLGFCYCKTRLLPGNEKHTKIILIKLKMLFPDSYVEIHESRDPVLHDSKYVIINWA